MTQLSPQYSQVSASVNKSAMLGNSGSSITNKNLSFGQTFKLKFLNFNGKDPNSWIYIVEEYQVQLPFFHFEGITQRFI